MSVKPRKPGRKAGDAHAEFLDGLLDSTRLVIYLKDLDGRYLYVNRRYELLSGAPRAVILGKRDHDLFPKAVADLFREQDALVVSNRKALEFEETIPLPGGVLSFITEKFPLLDEKGAVYATGGFCTEITAQKKRAEEELFKIRSLESLGFLAGGIAHDFNNHVTGIMGNLDLLGREAELAGDAREMLDDAVKICAKAGALAHQLRTFADGGTPVRRVFALGPLLRGAPRLVLQGSRVRDEVDAPRGLWAVHADETQISQVLGNLLVNAREAMPAGGTVSIRAENHVLAEPTADLKPGRYVRITVRDDGPGIPAAILSRIFDPYFSSKERGSGLGLSIVHSVVRRHGGHVWAESVAGRGALFTFLLPAADGKPPRRAGKRRPRP
ncbi:MAG: PAS domain-containing protein [Elusimicrobia bacterium]|nr:PAS domain-containing protein [Elusimicrobiota bacterium]